MPDFSNPPFALLVDPGPGVGLAIQTYQNQSAVDLLLSLSVPRKDGWGAVGIGDDVAGSIMFVTYPTADASTSALSVRSATGHDCPAPVSNVNCQVLDGSVDDAYMRTVFTCYGLGSDQRLRKDPGEVAWYYALGSGNASEAHSNNASINKASGYFLANITAARSSPWSDPGLLPVTRTMATNIHTQMPRHDFPHLVKAHASLLAGSFVIIFPIGIILLRTLSPKWHWPVQTLGTTMCLCGMIIGLVMSKGSPWFFQINKPHQIIGLTTVSLIIIQFCFGWFHYLLFYKPGIDRSWITKIHMGCGRVFMGLGMINAILGFLLARSRTGAIAYGTIAGVVWFSIFSFSIWRQHRGGVPIRKESIGMSRLPEQSKGKDK